MLNITVLTSVAKSALVGAVATKLVDTFVSTKINNKFEQNKWLRSTKLELFSKLTEEIIVVDLENFKIYRQLLADIDQNQLQVLGI